MNFEIKQGIIASPRSVNSGNLFRVKIVPDMSGIEDPDMLPAYANFLKDNDVAYQTDEPVWCLCNEDFTVGFIMGSAQNVAGDNITGVINLIRQAEQEANFLPLSGYNDLSVFRFSGASFQFVNVNTGSSGTIFNNKAIFLVSSDGAIWVKNTGFNMMVSADGDLHLQGKSLNQTFSEEESTIKGNSLESVRGSKRIESSGKTSIDASGNLDLTSGSNMSINTAGEKTETTGGKVKQTSASGFERTSIAGSIKDTVLTGGYHLSVVAGHATLSVSFGTLSIYGGAGLKLSSTTQVEISAPSITLPLGMTPPGGVGNPLSPGGFNAIPVCPVSGLPHSTNVLMGPVVNLPPVDIL